MIADTFAKGVYVGAAAAIAGVAVGVLASDWRRSRWRRYRCGDCGRVFRSRVRYLLHRLQPGPTL